MKCWNAKWNQGSLVSCVVSVGHAGSGPQTKQESGTWDTCGCFIPFIHRLHLTDVWKIHCLHCRCLSSCELLVWGSAKKKEKAERKLVNLAHWCLRFMQIHIWNWCMRNFCMSGAEPRLKFGERNPLWRKCSKQSAGCVTHVNRMLYILICHGLLARNIETKGLQNFVLSKSEPISDAATCRAENTSGMKSPMLSRSFPQHTFTWHAITDIVQNHLCLVADCLQGSTRSRGALLQQRCHQGWEPLGFLFVDKSRWVKAFACQLIWGQEGRKGGWYEDHWSSGPGICSARAKQGTHMETNNNYTTWVRVKDAIHCKDSFFIYNMDKMFWVGVVRTIDFAHGKHDVSWKFYAALHSILSLLLSPGIRARRTMFGAKRTATSLLEIQ